MLSRQYLGLTINRLLVILFNGLHGLVVCCCIRLLTVYLVVVTMTGEVCVVGVLYVKVVLVRFSGQEPEKYNYFHLKQTLSL